MAKIIPVMMTAREFMRQRKGWATLKELSRMYGLSCDALQYRIRRYKGRIELLSVSGDRYRFKARFYSRRGVWRAVDLFKRRESEPAGESGNVYVTSKEAARLLGFASMQSFNTWKLNCEMRPKAFKRWVKYPSGKARWVPVYELESLYECRNWFLQRKRCVDRLPSLSDARSWSYDARRGGAEAWEQLGYSYDEYHNDL